MSETDLISRRAAIDAAIDAVDDWDGGYNLTRADMIAKAINDIEPSAQSEIIRCKDCCLRYTSCPMVVRDGGYISFFTEDDDFCSRGRRRREEE